MNDNRSHGERERSPFHVDTPRELPEDLDSFSLSRRELLMGADAVVLGWSDAPWDFRPQCDASLEYVGSEASGHQRPGQLRPRGGLPG